MKTLWITLFGLFALTVFGGAYYALRPVQPITEDIYVVTQEDKAISFRLKTLQGDPSKLSYEIVKQPQNGELRGMPPMLVYQADADFFGEDQVIYQARNGDLEGNYSIVRIKVEPVNDSPVPEYQSLETKQNKRLKLRIKGHDPDGDFLTYKLLGQPQHGRLEGKAPNLVYVPKRGFSGIDSFAFMVADGKRQSVPGTIEIEVYPKSADRNTPLYTTAQDKTLEIPLVDAGPKSKTVAVEWVRRPKHGKLSVSQGMIHYAPDPGFSGRDRFEYKTVSEAKGGRVHKARILVFSEEKGLAFQRLLSERVEAGGVAIGQPTDPDQVYHAGSYVPASIIKIATAAAALKRLGPDFRFETLVYLDEQNNLYLKGKGDPSLTASNWQSIVENLVVQNKIPSTINAVVLDDTAFEKGADFDGRTKSLNYFEAPIGALSTNENMTLVEIDQQKKFRSKIAATPLTPMVRKRLKGLPPGLQKLAVPQTSQEAAFYTAELVEAILNSQGVECKTKPRLGKVPLGLAPLVVHRSSKDLHEIVREMLKESSNFIANQLVMAMALQRYGEPAELDKGMLLLENFLSKDLGLKDSEFHLVEGSGLSKENRIDLIAMLKVVKHFEPYKELIPTLAESRYYSLNRLGRKWLVRAKSGTLRGAYNLAGFFQVTKNHWEPFVIMLGPRQRQERSLMVETIARYYSLKN